MPPDGTLGDALAVRDDLAEIPCGTWATFKLCRHLIEFTGEARYGHWIEDLLYNGIGAALPTRSDGSTYYYANYRVGMATKVYYFGKWPCCSGTYIQDVADYHNIIYFLDDAGGLHVNLLLPSTVQWIIHRTSIRVSQVTEFPGKDECTFSVEADQPVNCTIRIRVPPWSGTADLTVNGEKINDAPIVAGWLTLRRTWDKDKISVRFPMQPRPLPVDRQHTNRIAVKYGPLLMVQDARYTYPIRGDQSTIVPNLIKVSNLPELRFGTLGNSHYSSDAVLADVSMANGEQIGHFVPLWSVPETNPYRTYFDMDRKTFF